MKSPPKERLFFIAGAAAVVEALLWLHPALLLLACGVLLLAASYQRFLDRQS